MDVLYISYDGVLDPLGGSQVTPYLEGLSGDINLVLLSFEKKHKLEESEKLARIKNLLSENAISWRYLTYHKSPAIPATIWDIFSGLITGTVLAKKYCIEVVHARGYISAIIALFLKKIYKIKFIFDIRGLWPDEKVEGGAWKKSDITYKVFKYMEKVFFRNCDWVVVLSRKGESLLKKMYHVDGKISFIPTCADLDLFDYKNKEKSAHSLLAEKYDFVFLYNGSLGTWYMLEEMVDFFKASLALFKKPLFLFLNDADRLTITAMMKTKGVSEESYLVEFSERPLLTDWISIADACVIFIKPVFSKTVSCPTKFAESLACGVPVIINPGVGDTQEIVENEKVGVVIRDFSLDSYKNALKELRKLLSEPQSLKQRCRQAAEKYFSLKDGVCDYLYIYKRLER